MPVIGCRDVGKGAGTTPHHAYAVSTLHRAFHEQFARSILAEFEGLSVSSADTPAKKPNIAALTEKGSEKGKKGDRKSEGGKPERPSRKACEGGQAGSVLPLTRVSLDMRWQSP